MQQIRNKWFKTFFAGMALGTVLAVPSDAQAATNWHSLQPAYVYDIIANADGSLQVYLEDADGDVVKPCSLVFGGNTRGYATHSAATGTPNVFAVLTSSLLAHKPVLLYVTANAAGDTSCTFTNARLVDW